MNFQYYVNYIAIVEEGSLTSASNKLGVAQPALSNQIKAMEQVYNTRLFHRGSGSHRLELTETGRILYEKSKIMVEAENSAKNEIADHVNGTRTILKIGVLDSLDSRGLMALINEYSEQYPETEIVLREASLDELIKMMGNGLIDASFVRVAELPQYEDLDVIFSLHDYLVACYQKDVFFIGNNSPSVTISELAKFPLCVSGKNLPLMRTAFREQGSMFMPRFVGPDTNACLLWAKAGKGVALVPLLSIRMHGFSDLKYKEIQGREFDAASFSMIAHKRQHRSETINKFLNICAEMGKSAHFPISLEGIFPDKQ